MYVWENFFKSVKNTHNFHAVLLRSTTDLKFVKKVATQFSKIMKLYKQPLRYWFVVVQVPCFEYISSAME